MKQIITSVVSGVLTFVITQWIIGLPNQQRRRNHVVRKAKSKAVRSKR